MTDMSLSRIRELNEKRSPKPPNRGRKYDNETQRINGGEG